MGYDVELIAMKTRPQTGFPLDQAAAERQIAAAALQLDAEQIKQILLAIPGAKPGPDDSIDYLGAGLGYARLFIKPAAVHVENNCSPKDLLKMQAALQDKLGHVFIYDLQSRQLHDVESFTKWWSQPL